jgi:predicted 2-oxoglutarate/Fe(II)-dependent dioxygenase YbiX
MGISFSTKECEDIINLTEELPSIQPYYSKNDNFKVGYSAWKISLNDDTRWIFEKISKFFMSKTNLKIRKELDVLYVHKYNVGQQFEKHNDTNYKTQIHNVGVCLNDNYDGGEFILYDPDEVIPKKQGEIYTFPSLQYHEVKEIKKGQRWSIIGFLHMENIESTNRSLL